MSALTKGRYVARVMSDAAEVQACLDLRRAVFASAGAGDDRDQFDAKCQHHGVIDQRTGVLMATFRTLLLPDSSGICDSYSGQSYDLSKLAHYPGASLELGRFCVRAGAPDPDILRTAWAAITRLVDGQGIRLLFGCSSFAGTDPLPYRRAFERLSARHLAPECWRPARKAGETHDFAQATCEAPAATGAEMPSLLRTYLLMGGWVSDHAVIDRHMNTLHVFTGVEIDLIPEARKRLLRADAD